jgi:hypothetical protein
MFGIYSIEKTEGYLGTVPARVVFYANGGFNLRSVDCRHGGEHGQQPFKMGESGKHRLS